MHAKKLFRHKWMELCQGLNGEPFIRGIGDGVCVVPIDAQGNVLMCIEPAVSTGLPVLGLPAGTVEDGEDPSAAANRELQEEIGFKAARLDVLTVAHPLARHADWRVHLLLAQELSPCQLPGDEAHEIHVEAVALSTFETLVDDGRLSDSSCIAALYLARRALQD
ncbi:MAG: NUDIX domain-containing protein [Kiritimatiellae bacterium]|nr:NUDIX domain-containing protein [Kiritimatiellia bacterium]